MRLAYLSEVCVHCVDIPTAAKATFTLLATNPPAYFTMRTRCEILPILEQGCNCCPHSQNPQTKAGKSGNRVGQLT